MREDLSSPTGRSDVSTCRKSWLFTEFLGGEPNTLDLHGASKRVSNVADRCFLEEFRSGRQILNDMAIVTGRGNNSAGAPVLLTSVRSFLRKRDGPAITEVASNPGCFILTEGSIKEWLSKTR